MSPDARINLIGLILSGAMTAMLAGVLRWFSSSGSHGYYKLWSTAWFFIAGYYLAGGLSFALGVLGTSSVLLRFVLSSITQSASTIGSFLLVHGAIAFATRGEIKRRRLLQVLLLGLALGVLVAAVSHLGGPRLVRQLYRTGLATVTFIAAAVIIWRSQPGQSRPGRLLAVALTGFGLTQLQFAVYWASTILGRPYAYPLGTLAFLDLVWMSAIVATMSAMALADQAQMAGSVLRAQESRFQRMIEYTNDIVTVLTDRFRVIYMSPSGTRILGWGEELSGQDVFEWVHPDDQAAVRAIAAVPGRGAKPFQYRFRDRAGNWVRLESVATRVQEEGGGEVVVVNSRDMTDRDRLEANMRQTQRLESIGRLAGGVAHDLNNILWVIGGTAQAGRASAAPASDQKAFDEIIVATDRATDLTRQLLSFARRQMVAPLVFDVVESVERTARMAARLMPQPIELRVMPCPERHLIHADPIQVDQVVMNLLVNARDAIPATGLIEVRIGRAEVLPEQHDGAVAGPYVTISVRDTGVGMSDLVLPFLFEPFFTTKPVGQGTGLGLATSYGIVKQAGGFIEVTSREGVGSEFVVHFPAATGDAPQPERVAVPAATATANGEMVLVTEDDPDVRRIVATMLRRAGYQTIEASDGLEALEVARQQPIRVLVTDMLMPKLNGLELARRLRERDPGLAVLLVSGYPGDPAVLQSLPPGTVFLQKPVRPEELLERIRSLL